MRLQVVAALGSSLGAMQATGAQDGASATCRSDICTDIGGDCCAPGSESRGCRESGYAVATGGTSLASACAASYGASAIYQCCPERANGLSTALSSDAYAVVAVRLPY